MNGIYANPTAFTNRPSIPIETQRELISTMFTGDEDIPEILVSQKYLGINLDQHIDVFQNTATHWAATLGRTGILRLLISRGKLHTFVFCSTISKVQTHLRSTQTAKLH